MNTSSNHIVFETERLLIRPYTMDDLSLFFLLNGNEEVMRYIRPAQTLKQSTEFLQRIVSDYDRWPGMGRWAMLAKEDERFVGSFAIIPIDNTDNFQLGYALVKEAWGHGYASESVKGGLQYAFEGLKLSEIAGITYPENIPSQRVLIKNGFVFDKTFLEENRPMNVYIRRRSQ